MEETSDCLSTETHSSCLGRWDRCSCNLLILCLQFKKVDGCVQELSAMCIDIACEPLVQVQVLST